MKTILVPTDFSENAGNACSYALRLAEVLKAKLILLNACHVPAMASELRMEDITMGTIIEEATERLKEFREFRLHPDKNITVEGMVAMGFAVDSIVSAAAETKADMIVMGTKGASGIEGILLGSNTAAVIEKTSCSVLAVPEDANFGALKKIAFATEYRDTDIRSINFLASIAAPLNSEILIVHISDVLNTEDVEEDLLKSFEEKVRKEIPYKNFSFHLAQGLHLDEALHVFIEHYHVELIALATRKRTFLTKFFDKSLTRKLAYHTHVPLLSIHL